MSMSIAEIEADPEKARKALIDAQSQIGSNATDIGSLKKRIASLSAPKDGEYENKRPEEFDGSQAKFDAFVKGNKEMKRIRRIAADANMSQDSYDALLVLAVEGETERRRDLKEARRDAWDEGGHKEENIMSGLRAYEKANGLAKESLDNLDPAAQLLFAKQGLDKKGSTTGASSTNTGTTQEESGEEDIAEEYRGKSFALLTHLAIETREDLESAVDEQSREILRKKMKNIVEAQSLAQQHPDEIALTDRGGEPEKK